VNKRILIADDEPSIVMALEFLFRQAGHCVETVGDGADVMARTLACLPDLVVLDVMLPNRSGFDLCRDLREDPRTAATPIVMLTAKGRRAEIDAGLAAGADAYVTKPFGTRDLLDTVQALLDR
jgi:DNA-binding response OmpR family regulator